MGDRFDWFPGPGGDDEKRVHDAIAALASGRMVVLTGAEGRTRQGDLILAAEHADASAVNRMIRMGRGIVSVGLPPSRSAELGLPTPIGEPGDRYPLLIDARRGISTGVSAQDRARTLSMSADPDSGPDDFTVPGHVGVLTGHPQGVRGRQGRVEVALDLARLGGLRPAVALCEVLGANGNDMGAGELIAEARRQSIAVIDAGTVFRYLRCGGGAIAV